MTRKLHCKPFQCGTEADKTSKDKPRAGLEQSDGGNDPLLSEIKEDLLNIDKSGPADSINNLWSKQLPDSRLKDKSGKFLRPASCEILATLRVNILNSGIN